MKLHDIDLNLLVSLEVLLQECNVTYAAERLHISQSAVSAQLETLRTTFSDPLLLPTESVRGMAPTALGHSLKEPLASALHTLGNLVRYQPSFDPRTDVRIFHIAASDNAMIALGVPLLTKLHTYAPNTLRFVFTRPHKELIAAQCERGEIDLLIDGARLIPQNMKTQSLFSSDFVMAQRKGHPRGIARLDLDTYCQLPHMMVAHDTGSTQGYMDEYLSTLHRSRNVVITLAQLSLVAETLRHSDFVCTLPAALFARTDHDLKLFELPFKAPAFSLNMAWHPRNQFDPGVAWLRSVIDESVGC